MDIIRIDYFILFGLWTLRENDFTCMMIGYEGEGRVPRYSLYGDFI
jgi:hypothetical protein